MTSDDKFLDTRTFLGDGEPDTLDQRLAREIPEEGQDVPFERQPDAVGELVTEEDEDGEEQVILAQEAGRATPTAPAEQRAMHVLDEEFVPEEDYSAFVSDVDDEDDDEDEGELVEDGIDVDGDGVADRGEIERDDDADEFVFNSENDDDYVADDDES